MSEHPVKRPPDWRAECAWLVDLAEDRKRLPDDPERDRLAAIRAKLDEPPSGDPVRQLAAQTIERMGAGLPISAEGVRAIVEVAGEALAWPEAPFLAEAADVVHRLGEAILVSGGNPLAVDSRALIAKLSVALRASERERFRSDAMLRAAAVLIERDAKVFREYEQHHRARIGAAHADDRERKAQRNAQLADLAERFVASLARPDIPASAMEIAL